EIARQKEAAAKAKDMTASGAQLQGQIPSRPPYELLQGAGAGIEKLQEQAKVFEFHGYFRCGYGVNSEGGQQVPFQAPGAGAKYRLGNETETYGEFILVNKLAEPRARSGQGVVQDPGDDRGQHHELRQLRELRQ